ncbi:glycosyltransferase family 4 protein [Pectobacterium versatile]|uniref:glycosyltransferase family 4 protein n=1 Tax=Pectobacterium versatile TaxID=2488639 RepID=UPI000F647972|nr:glycosyltransferase family 4 protein [Pectobacterium versatile]AZK62172.1 glycosyltransferase family 1 protein [Pectobacterium versatile]
MPKIVHIQVIPKMSGVQQVSFDILKNLPNDFEKYIVFGGMYECKDNIVEKFSNIGVKVIFIDSLRREIGFNDILSIIELYKFFKKEKFDIIHTNSTKPGIVARFAAWLSGCKKVVHTVHGIAFHRFEKLHKRIFFYLIETFFCFFSNTLISVNNHYLKFYPHVKNKICIYNSIDFIKKSQRDFNDDSDRPITVGFISRLDKQKDPITFLKAIEYGNRVGLFSQENVKVIIGGDGELKALCEAFVENERLSCQVKFKGWVSNKDDFFKEIDILCLPSIFEAFGLVFLEAGIFGIPSIASNVEGIPEIVKNDKNGFLVEPKNHIEIAQRISNYLKDRSLLKRHGMEAKRIVEEDFRMKDMLEKYLEVYKI